GGGGFRVDWFWPTSVKGDVSPWEGTDAATEAAFAAGFLDVLLEGGLQNLMVAERMLSVPVRVELGGSPTAGDTAEGREYNRSWLHLQLKKYAADSYEFQKAAPGEGGSH